jgi:hypothetical protein
MQKNRYQLKPLFAIENVDRNIQLSGAVDDGGDNLLQAILIE